MPDPSWLQVGVPAAIAGTAFLSRLVLRHQRLLLWERSAKAVCRDDQVKISGFLSWRRRLTARVGPNELRITDARGRGRDVVVEIEGAWNLSGMKIRRQGFSPWKGEVEIGDEPFDQQLVLEGPPLAVGARLDVITRRRLLSAVSGCATLEIDGGRLRAKVADEDLRRILPILLDIGQRLARTVRPERRIAQNARRDPVAGARLFNLLLLARERPGEAETLAALRHACSDESPVVRVRAAIELGDEGCGVLLKMAEKSVHDESAAQAVSHLGGALPFESLRDILVRSVPSLSKKSFELPRTARACVEELGRRGAAAVGVLAQLLTQETGELAAAAARALGTTGEASAERALLRALESGDEGVWVAAATALGRAGTAAAVPALQEAADRSWLNLSLRRAARQAVVEIQSRLEGAAPGQLSLAGAEGGQLALATDDAGQLALATEAAGEPALLPHGAEAEGSLPDGPRQRVRPELS